MIPPDMDLDRECLIHLHLPKVAGSTFRHLLAKQFDQLTVHIIRSPHDENVKHFVEMDAHERETIRFITGHMRFGIHEALPQPARYITLIREPVDRMISHYFHAKRKPDHRLHDPIMKANMSLADYIRSGLSSELENGQTRMLAGMPELEWMEPDPQPCPPEALEAAKRNLDAHFLCAGVFDAYGDTIQTLNALLGWNIVLPPKKIVNSRAKPDEISDTDRDALLEQNQLDTALYEYAQEQFQALRNELQQSGAFDQVRTVHKGWVDDRPLPRRIASRIKARLTKGSSR